MSDRIVVIGKHSLNVTGICGQYRVWCRPCGYEEWFSRRWKADNAADVHLSLNNTEPYSGQALQEQSE